MPNKLAEIINKQLEDLEQKISSVAYICYPESQYNRSIITNSMIKVLGSELMFNEHIKGYKELGFIKAFYNLLMAECAIADGDIALAIIHISEGNFDIGDFYGSFYVARRQRQEAGKNRARSSHPNKEQVIKYWEENKTKYERKGDGGKDKAIFDMLDSGLIVGVAHSTMRDWLKNK